MARPPDADDVPRSLQVPVDTVGRGRGRGRGLGAVAVVLVATGIVAAGVGGRWLAQPPPPVPSPPPSVAYEKAAPSSAPLEPPTSPGLALPVLPSEPLAGAPVLGLWRRSGDDAVVLTWDPARPARGVTESRRIPAIFAGMPSDAAELLVGSPSGRLVLGSGLESRAGSDDVERLRVTTAAGKAVWTGTVHDTVLSAPVWNPMRDELIVPTLSSWRIVTFGAAGGSPRVRTVPVPRRELEPVGRLTAQPVVPAIVGFSPDGRTAYAATSESPFTLGLRPLFSLDLRTLVVRSITRLPSRLADMTSLGGSSGPARIDPTSGRVLGPPGPGASRITVYGRDGSSPAVESVGGQIIDAAWIGGGRLAVLRTDPAATLDDPGATRIDLVSSAGRTTSDISLTSRINEGTVVAAPGGYLLVVLGAGTDYAFAAIRLRDGATTAVPVAPETLSSLRFLGWLPPSR